MDAKQLLADAAWLRRLASSLAADPDDLVQESWIAAWRKQPAEDLPLRPWLAKVVRDLAAMRGRSERRRLVRDAHAVDEREVPEPSSMLEQVRLHRLLADLVLALDEPYRGTIVARFFEDKSSAQLARELGIPDATVRARVREGLARLRVGLDRETGSRKAWAVVFLRGGLNVAKPSKSIAVLVALVIALFVVGAALVVRYATGAQMPEQTATRAERVQHHGDAKPGLPMVVVDGRRIAGRVVADGRPVAGASVRLVGAGSIDRTTDETGHFDFGTVPRAAYSIGAVAPARLAAVQQIDSRAAQPVDELELVLLACESSLFGRVTTPSGAPIGGAEVLREDVIGVTTDDDGQYDLCVRRVALENHELRTIVRAAGFASQEVLSGLQGRHAHDFVLVPETVIHGRVVDETGRSVADAAVLVTTPTHVPHSALAVVADATANTDERGAFVVRGVEPGAHHFTVRAPGLISITDDAHDDVAITLHPSASVRGRAVSGGRPVVGATMSIAEVSAVTDGDGRFAIDDVVPGEAKIEASPYRAHTVALHAGINDLTVEVEASVTVRGTITQQGVVVANARVMVNSGDDYHPCYSDSQGHFELLGVTPGHYTGLADTEDTYAELDWTIGASDVTQNIVLPPAKQISGIVVDASNQPVARVNVRFEPTTSSSNYDHGRCTTDETGAFSCGHMAGGIYRARVFFSENGQPELHLDHELIPLDHNVDQVRLVVDARRLAIRGTVKDRSGVPLANVRVSATDGHEANTAPLMTTATDEHGLFTVRGLAPGRYALEAYSDQGTDIESADAGGIVSLVVGRCEPTTTANPTFKPTQRLTFDNRVELVGWDGPMSVRAGEPVTMTLYWKSLQSIDQPYGVFVHVAGEHLWINADHQPASGRCSTTSWQSGDVIVDRFSFGTAVDFNGHTTAPGTYTIDVGLFRGFIGHWENMKPSAPGPLTSIRFD